MLIEKNLITNFIVPKNIPLQQAKNASKAGLTIASVVNISDTRLNADDINERVLSLIVNDVWEQTFKLFDILEKGNQLIEQAGSSFIPYAKEMTREDALYAVIKNMHIEFRGLSNRYTFSTRFKGYDNLKFIEIMNKYVTANYNHKWNICGEEINRYFNPSKELVNCILVLLAAAQINPESAATLEIGCLTEDADQDIARLSWIKHRAGGEQQSIPFPNGKHTRSKTIPNIIRLFEKYSVNIRKKASPNLQSQLFIWNGYQINRMDKIQNYSYAGKDQLKILMGMIKDNLIKKQAITSEYKIAIQACDQLTLSLIRATALNTSSTRLNRDISSVAAMDGRKSEEVLTEHYLNNNSTRDAFDLQIRESQNLMYEWVNAKPIVISENEANIVSKLNISEENAKKLIHDEFNNGYGAALINQHVIIIDSALNALRIIQWLKKLEDSEKKMLISNPERWNNIYLPQKKLFNKSLSLISKKNKAEALKMNKEINLPFPEVL